MSYFAILILLIASIHPLSYAKFNWDQKNKLAALGAVFLAVCEVAFPTVFIILR